MKGKEQSEQTQIIKENRDNAGGIRNTKDISSEKWEDIRIQETRIWCFIIKLASHKKELSEMQQRKFLKTWKTGR